MRSRFSTCPSAGLVAAVCLTALGASCHFHDDDGASAGGLVVPPGSSGFFGFTGPNRDIREGEIGDIVARIASTGDLAQIVTWELVTPDGSLVDLTDPSAVRLVAGAPGNYGIRATDVNGEVGTFGFTVVSARGQLTVTEVVDGFDTDDVVSRVATSGDDMFLAERIGDAQAPQVFARIARNGDREASVNLPYKIVDLGADEAGNVVTMELGATNLADALRRYDRGLVEDTGFSAPDLGPGVTFADVLSVTDDGTTVIVTSELGGAVVCLDATGAIAAGTAPRNIPFAPADVVDIATDVDGLVYVATETEIIRLDKDGTALNIDWNPAPRTALTAMSTDGRGVLYVISQDQEGGQCGSLRKINWLGSEFAVLTEYSEATFFAARKFVHPLDICAYGNGSWRVYDDTVSIDPGVQHAAWIVAGIAPPDLSQKQ